MIWIVLAVIAIIIIVISTSATTPATSTMPIETPTAITIETPIITPVKHVYNFEQSVDSDPTVFKNIVSNYNAAIADPVLNFRKSIEVRDINATLVGKKYIDRVQNMQKNLAEDTCANAIQYYAHAIKDRQKDYAWTVSRAGHLGEGEISAQSPSHLQDLCWAGQTIHDAKCPTFDLTKDDYFNKTCDVLCDSRGRLLDTSYSEYEQKGIDDPYKFEYRDIMCGYNKAARGCPKYQNMSEWRQQSICDPKLVTCANAYQDWISSAHELAGKSDTPYHTKPPIDDRQISSEMRFMLKNYCETGHTLEELPCDARSQEFTRDGIAKRWCRSDACVDARMAYNAYTATANNDKIDSISRQGLLDIIERCKIGHNLADSCGDRIILDDPAYKSFCEQSQECLTTQMENIEDIAAIYRGDHIDPMTEQGIDTIKKHCDIGHKLEKQCGNRFVVDHPFYKPWCAQPSECFDHAAQLHRNIPEYYNTATTPRVQLARAARDICPHIEFSRDSCPAVMALPFNAGIVSKCDMGSKCMQAQSDMIFARDTAQLDNVNVASNPDLLWQQMSRGLCPSMSNVVHECTSSAASGLVNSLKADGLYKQFCENPECAAAKHNAYMQRQRLDPNIAADKQHERLINFVCPAALEENRVCGVAINPAICANLDCIVATRDVQGLTKTIDWAASQGQTEAGTTQQIIEQLCPLFKTALNKCGNDPTVLNHYYDDYCSRIDCINAQTAVSNARTKYASWATSAKGKYDALLGDVCPSFARELSVCKDSNIKSDPLYTQYCSFGTPCLEAQKNMYTEVEETDRVRYSYDDNSFTQRVKNRLCPIFKDVKAKCTDPASTAYITRSPYWKNYCNI